jgi:hypothetical protein
MELWNWLARFKRRKALVCCHQGSLPVNLASKASTNRLCCRRLKGVVDTFPDMEWFSFYRIVGHGYFPKIDGS